MTNQPRPLDEYELRSERLYDQVWDEIEDGDHDVALTAFIEDAAPGLTMKVARESTRRKFCPPRPTFDIYAKVELADLIDSWADDEAERRMQA